jgi:hypothetical protein
MEFSLSGILNNVVHISGIDAEDGRIVELNALSLVDAVLICSQHLDRLDNKPNSFTFLANVRIIFS